jgi:hypothetical protein
VSEFQLSSMPPPPEGAFHLPYGPGPTEWHTGHFQECEPCLIAAGVKQPEGPAPMPTHDHESAGSAMAELGAQAWGTANHPTLVQTFAWQVDWSGPVPQFKVRIVPADGRELDSSSIQELAWDMLAVDPDQVSGQGAE